MFRSAKETSPGDSPTVKKTLMETTEEATKADGRAGFNYRFTKSRLIVILAVVFLVGGATGAFLYGSLYLGFPPPIGELIATPDGWKAGYGEDGKAALPEGSIGRMERLSKYLKDNYYRPVTDGAIETGLLRGLFMSPGDPYTIYYTEDEFKATMENTHGELSGVGMTLTVNADGIIEVVDVLDGSPARKAGVRAGDLLLSVDGTAYSGAQLAEAVEAARGEPGTKVVIGINRGGDMISYTMTRSVFVTPTVSHEIMKNNAGGDVGYIHVTSFNDNTAADFQAALKAVNESEARGLVVDVRNNAGGLVDKAVEMDDMLLDEGVICYAEDGKGNRTEYAAEDGRDTDLPYAVLIDGTSVSAAEIFALGVKAGGGGKLVGETTYGKGLIQKLEKFDEGDGVRITIMQYITPDGEPVNGVGIAPDVAVKQPESAERGTRSDAQLQKALALF
jgi:carboxyl-terminal processing protease